ncbi:unnamed protein product [Pieris macdunnoughi]|uniref:Uncharacterized protein n=1 Tax=Pieris macdunnoughi TaxID=345717 RepID=A0A821XPB0_9NEOP|nr:unnamed protein product [Pieris macdunnoughi]
MAVDRNNHYFRCDLRVRGMLRRCQPVLSEFPGFPRRSTVRRAPRTELAGTLLLLTSDTSYRTLFSSVIWRLVE